MTACALGSCFLHACERVDLARVDGLDGTTQLARRSSVALSLQEGFASSSSRSCQLVSDACRRSRGPSVALF
jgi:hypothetical protein